MRRRRRPAPIVWANIGPVHRSILRVIGWGWALLIGVAIVIMAIGAVSPPQTGPACQRSYTAHC